MNSKNSVMGLRLLALLVLSLALHLCGTWILPLIDRDEPRFAEASREMRERGDWILPTFNNQPRYDKPPLTYWCQIASYRVFGENEFAARFHSALAAALTALVVFGFCARLYDERAAWRAAIAFTLCLQVFVHAKASVADMPMVLFFALATWAGWELAGNLQVGDQQSAISNQKSKIPWWWIFYFALALGFLAKGPVTLLPLGGILIYAKWRRMACLNPVLKLQYGIPLFFLLVGFWGVPALVKTGGDFFKVGIGHHVIERSFSPLEGHGAKGALTYFLTLPFYFLTVFAGFFPGSLFFKKTIQRIKMHCTDADRFLLCGIGLVFLVFTLVKTKLPHYTLPAFPLLACLIAPQLASMRSAAFAKLAGGAVVVSLGFSFLLFPLATRYLLPVKQALGSMVLPPETEFASVDYDEPSQIWYFRGRVKTWHTLLRPRDVADFMNQPGPRICVIPADLAVSGSDWKTTAISGFNPARGKRVNLVIATKGVPSL